MLCNLGHQYLKHTDDRALPAEGVVPLVLNRAGPLCVSVRTPRIFQHVGRADTMGLRASCSVRDHGDHWYLRLNAAGLLSSTEQNQH